MDLIAAIVALLVVASPPGRPTWIEEAKESQLEAEGRYQSIAAAVLEVVDSSPPLFDGTHGRERTIATLLAVAWHESGFRRDVDLGIGKHSKGGGVDCCLMQIRLSPNRGTTSEGWTCDDLTSDRGKCFRVGLRLIRQSMNMCRNLAVGDRLSAYTTGGCRENERYSRARVGRAALFAHGLIKRQQRSSK